MKKKKTKKKINYKGARPTLQEDGTPFTGTVKVPTDYWGQDPKLIWAQPPRADAEDDVLEVKDKFSKHAYPPPRKDPLFRVKWGKFIDNVVGRKNFHIGHLETLKVFCDVLVEYETLQAFIRKNGSAYATIGRQGQQWKLYPQVGQLNVVKDMVAKYCKLLDLILKKDEGDGGETGDEEKWT